MTTDIEIYALSKNSSAPSDDSSSSEDGTFSPPESPPPITATVSMITDIALSNQETFVLPPKKTELQVRSSTAQLILLDDTNLGKKYERVLTMANADIAIKDDMLNAVILQLKLPQMYCLDEDEQFEKLRDKYPWIDEELDQFELEETIEVVAHMTAVDRRSIHDTIEEYDEVNIHMHTHPILKTQNRMMKKYAKDMYWMPAK